MILEGGLQYETVNSHVVCSEVPSNTEKTRLHNQLVNTIDHLVDAYCNSLINMLHSKLNHYNRPTGTSLSL